MGANVIAARPKLLHWVRVCTAFNVVGSPKWRLGISGRVDIASCGIWESSRRRAGALGLTMVAGLAPLSGARCAVSGGGGLCHDFKQFCPAIIYQTGLRSQTAAALSVSSGSGCLPPHTRTASAT